MSAQLLLEGRARVFGDDVNTDYIISSSRKKETLDPDVLRRFLMEALDPAFAASVVPGDLIVAGRGFGGGSAMEVAVTVLTAAGIRAVIARSFSRTYYRNAINNGLLPIECDTAGIVEGDTISVTVASGRTEVFDRTLGLVREGAPFPGFVLDILRSGGIVPYLRAHGAIPAPESADR